MGSIISDRYIPQLGMGILLDELGAANNIISQGVVTVDPNPVIKGGGYKFEIPFINRLSLVAAPVRIGNTTTLVPNSITDTIEYGCVVMDGDAITDTDFMNLRRGNNALQVIMQQILPVAQTGIQTTMKNVIDGVFTTALATTHSYDVASGESGDGTIKFTTIGNAAVLLGESAGDLTTLFVHSEVANGLYKEGLEVGLNFQDRAAQSGNIPVFAGRRVVINDTICAKYTEDGTTKYNSYLLGGQPFYLGINDALRIEEDRNILYAGGANTLAWYIDYVPHIKGVSYIGTNNPSNATLATGASWEKRSNIQDKQIKIIKLVSNL